MFMKMSRKTLMRYGLLAAAAFSLSSAVAISMWPGKALGKCGANAGEGNGSELFGDPGASGAHNQVGNNNANPNSAAAQADLLDEVDDGDEPN